MIRPVSPSRLPSDAPVLCIHGSAGNGRQWRGLASLLAPSLRVLAPDLAGCGEGESWIIGKPMGLADEAGRLALQIDAAESGVHLLAHSYGAAVALELAMRRPHAVRSLVLYEPVRFALLAGEGGCEPSAERIAALARRIQLLVLSGSLQAAAELFVDFWSAPGTWAALPPERRRTVAARMPKVQAEFEALFNDRTPASAYAALRMPIRLLGGDRSPLPARRVLDLLAERLPRAEVIRIAGAGHMAPMADPALVLPHLPAWMRAGGAEERLAA